MSWFGDSTLIVSFNEEGASVVSSLVVASTTALALPRQHTCSIPRYLILQSLGLAVKWGAKK